LVGGGGGDTPGIAPSGGDGGAVNIAGGDGGTDIITFFLPQGDGGNVFIDGGAGTIPGNIFLGGTTGNVRIGDTTTPVYALEVAGVVKSESGRIVKTTRITDADSPYTALESDHHIACDTDGGAVIVNLPVGVDGTQYIIYNTGSSGFDVTMSPNGAELLFGDNSDYDIHDGSDEQTTYIPTEGWR
jgi:hypothetical protein